jgi:hypothetical protein
MIRRLVPSVLSLALAWSGPLLADSGPVTPPPLESRVGKTITVVEANKPQERAVIMQVWRLPSGQPAMQAHSLTTGEPLTIVEDEKAATAAERFRIFRWKADGTAPDGCPKPPAKPIVKQEAKPQTAVQQASQQMPQQVPTTLTARQQGVSPSVYVPRSQATQPVVQAQMQQPMPLPPTTSAYVRRQDQVPPRPIEPQPLQPRAGVGAAAPTQQMTPTPVMRTADGRQAIVVSEPGKPPRQCVILGHVAQADGTRGTRVQALDNGEVMFLVGCCLDSNCVPAKHMMPKMVASKPAPCPPPVVVQKAEPPKPIVIKKEEPPKIEVKPEPPKIEVPKVVEKQPEPKIEVPKVVEKQPEPKIEAPKPPVVVVSQPVERPIQVPLPLIPLSTCDPSPCVPPPQPPMMPYQTQNSPAWKAFEADVMPCMPGGYQGCGVPAVSYGDPLVNGCPGGDMASATHWSTGPYSPVVQLPVILGVDKVYADVQAEAIKRTVYLITVLKTSSHPANRIWAADRLKVVNDVSVRPYVIDALVNVAKADPQPLVRIAAMSSLTEMGAHTPAATTVMEEAMQDKDPRVRDCAEACLKHIGIDPAAKRGDAVRPVSGEQSK